MRDFEEIMSRPGDAPMAFCARELLIACWQTLTAAAKRKARAPGRAHIRAELLALSDHTLKDIAYSRFDIANAV